MRSHAHRSSIVPSIVSSLTPALFGTRGGGGVRTGPSSSSPPAAAPPPGTSALRFTIRSALSALMPVARSESTRARALQAQQPDHLGAVGMQFQVGVGFITAHLLGVHLVGVHMAALYQALLIPARH